jgi:TolB protein
LKRIGTIPILTLALVAMLVAPPWGRADYDYIDITNPFIQKIPLAVPVFKAFEENETDLKIRREASDLLVETLEFTRYFQILDRVSFLADAENPAIIGPNIDFSAWTGIGAELLITGGFLVKDGLIEMELRLFDTFKSELLVGKKYTARVDDQRRIIRRFCSEVIFHLTGRRGVFESRIAFVSTTSGNKEIYTCDFDGYGPGPFTADRNIVISPAWSSDGKWIAYTGFKRGNPDLYIKHIREKRGALVNRKGINSSPAWVPGKYALAATLSFTGDQEIYLLTGTGKIIKRLTHSRGIDVSPTFSPDGRKMAFVSKRAGTPQVYIRDMDTGETERLTFTGKYNTQPNWSPRGDKIAYTAMEKGELNLFVIGLDGQPPIQLTRDAGDNESPAWSPDGSLIAFSSTREGPSRIYVMTSFGTDQRRLLTLPGRQSEPTWSFSQTNNQGMSDF